MSPSRPRVVIIGGNFAGLVAASRLPCDYDVTVVDARVDFEWTPNIHEILSGVKDREGVVLPRAECVSRYGHSFVHDAVTKIDRDNSSVLTEGGLVLPYDVCLIAAGSQRTTFGIEGADEHALGFRLVEDAVRIASRLDKLAARKRRASIVIVGGGVSGIEALGEILRRRGQGDAFDIHVVEVESRILEQQPKGLASDAELRLTPYPVTLHTDAAVAQVDARSVTLASGKKLSADLCIWSAGLTLPDFLRDAGLNEADDDWLPVDDTLKSRYADNIFIAGDCASLPVPVRKQAYYAMDMGEVAGDNISRQLRNRRLRQFRAAPMPMLISFGDITTWLVVGESVVASPVLAAAKEGVYQATMARLESPKEPLRYSSDIVGRAAMATRRLLLPQLTPGKLFLGLVGSRIIP
ncbi:MAG: FAD-dependent oxidoreductase [Gammaproteobacteria bacterium]|nr:FAD-dependent oxidoreductase [Gammaproteobacteria bacterium]MBT8109219.1 FAD-dependent oxidoreductase [Gammaproteobacteria bacterium]NND46207.1 FAD-dependent oxidoreductase [Woeseiaceae bacterium]NNL43921.1 FAD-dependent oxidoreductase [Woeseiaceae bacterium]